MALVMVPLAVIVAALLEKPVVTQLSGSEGGSYSGGGDGADTATEGSAGSPAEAPPAFGRAEPGGMGSGSMFDRIAFVYDSTNKWMSLGLDQFWRKTLVQDCLRLEREDRVLDLATGTADVGLLTGARLKELADGAKGAGGAVLGVDPSSEMLRRGVAKVEERGLKGVVRLVVGDAQNLTAVRAIDAAGTIAAPTAGVETGSIDKISMAFGIRNVPDRSRALREMRRVLRGRPTNRVCILEFALPDGPGFLSRTARKFITHVIPLVGRVATLGSGSEEYQYFQRSILKFPRPLDFAASMAREGLPVQSITSFAYGAVHLYAAAPAAAGAPPQR